MLRPHYVSQWQQFLAAKSTYATNDYRWPEWHHKNRKDFLFWGLLPQKSALEQRIKAAQKQLSPYLLAGYHKQAHITLYAAGFLAEEKQYADDVTWQELQQQGELIQGLKLGHLKLKTGGLNSFLGAPFIEVLEEKGRLQQIQNALSETFGADREGSFTPHITLGLYNKPYCCQAIAESIEQINSELNKLLLFDCSQIHLIAYSSSDIRSPLRIIKTLCLDEKQS